MSFINTSSTARPVVIGIDHGFGNIKTAHSCFKTGVTAYDQEPTFKSNLLVYDGRYYIIGDDHKEFTADKSQDQDYYILTLAAVAVELRFRDLTSARVYLAAGLPLTWVSGQKDSFKTYLLQKDSVDFSFRGVDYHVEFAGAEIYPQGFSAVTDKLRDFRGVNMLCDIGNGTMNIMYINNGKPVPSRCFTEKYGTYQCTLAVREKLLRQFGRPVDDTVIENVLRYGEADIARRYLDAIRESAADYAAGIMRRLRDHEYDAELMKLTSPEGSRRTQRAHLFTTGRRPAVVSLPLVGTGAPAEGQPTPFAASAAQGRNMAPRHLSPLCARNLPPAAFTLYGRHPCRPSSFCKKKQKPRAERRNAMAIYHFEAKVISRGAGRSAVAAPPWPLRPI